MSSVETMHFTSPEARATAEALSGSRDPSLKVLSPETYGDSESVELMQRLMQARFTFIDKMGWLPGQKDDDLDRYDTDPRTIHILKLSKEGEVDESMRLTHIDSLDEALSVEMLNGNEDVKNAVLAQADRFTDREVWDLTRLIQPLDESASKAEIAAGYLELFGVGIDRTKSENLTWLFVTTKQVKRFLDACGFKPEVLASGKLSSGDQEDSYVCIVNMNETWDSMVERRDSNPMYGFALDRIEHGLAQTDSL